MRFYIGGGPGGYVAAIKAAQEGLKVRVTDCRLYGVCRDLTAGFIDCLH
jgi:pyruvate/2-oxoglutarate dehydrogenase complex dihydrolipoamide dehydrogenase (E3) component